MQVFIYGTLKKGQCRAFAMRGTFLGETRTLPKYRLNDLGAYPGLTKDEENGKAIFGELWDVDENCLFSLDRIEGHPTLFKREAVELEHPDSKDTVAYFWQGKLGKDCGVCWE